MPSNPKQLLKSIACNRLGLIDRRMRRNSIVSAGGIFMVLCRVAKILSMEKYVVFNKVVFHTPKSPLLCINRVCLCRGRADLGLS